MARYRGPACKLSRRVGTDLQLKSGVRAIDTKCKISTRPGEHGRGRSKESDFRRQLLMKQTIRYYYGMLEKQFRNYYKQAEKGKGATGENLMRLLESRLDNLVYRAGFAGTRAEARQLVSHGAIKVNGQRVNIPSYRMALGDVIEVAERAKSQLRIKAAMELAQQREPCDWLSVSLNEMKAVFTAFPSLTDLPSEFKVNLVVELYSK